MTANAKISSASSAMGISQALGAGLAVAVAVLSVWQTLGIDSESQKLLAATLAAIAATMIGFVLAAASIIWTAGKTQLVKMMRQTGHYSVLIADFRRTTWIYIGACLVGLAAIFTQESILRYTTIACELLFVWGSWSFVRATLRFFLFLEFANPSD